MYVVVCDQSCHFFLSLLVIGHSTFSSDSKLHGAVDSLAPVIDLVRFNKKRSWKEGIAGKEMNSRDIDSEI